MSKCEGFGHIQADCANTLKRNKALTASWSDDENTDEQESVEEYEKIIALTSFTEGNREGLNQPQNFSVAVNGETDDASSTEVEKIFDEEFAETGTAVYNKLVEQEKKIEA